MKIICAGMPKTGTKSISKALRYLGFTVFDWEEQTLDFLDHWVDVYQNGAPPDVQRVFQNADAVVDFPGNFFWEEILEAFPESKVILSEREEVSWVKSLENHLELREVERSSNFFRVKLSPTARKMDLVLYPHINAILGSTNSKSACISRKRYRMHNHRVKSLVPPEKLLLYNVKQGWKPLCDFLDCRVPIVAFPHENVKGDMVKFFLSKTRYGRQVKWEMQRATSIILSIIAVILAVFFAIIFF